ncbi:hypothetical protein LZ31DRAFT_233097 [Colletotrichum somersetense]|nr:hypothetical protein LZ31DRAFT_233097 [Colletotrichum somersetense]
MNCQLPTPWKSACSGILKPDIAPYPCSWPSLAELDMMCIITIAISVAVLPRRTTTDRTVRTRNVAKSTKYSALLEAPVCHTLPSCSRTIWERKKKKKEKEKKDDDDDDDDE